MEERKEAKFVSWDGQGVSVSGILLNIEAIEIDGKKVPRFTVLGGKLNRKQHPAEFVPDGEEYSFLGPYQVSKKIRPTDVRKFVEVVFTGVNRDVSREGNPMKEFRVAVWNGAIKEIPFLNALKITDEDIPF